MGDRAVGAGMLQCESQNIPVMVGHIGARAANERAQLTVAYINRHHIGGAEGVFIGEHH